MNEDIANALVELVATLIKAQDAILADPQRTAAGLTALIGAIESVVEKHNQNQYEETDRQVVRSLIDFAAAELATTVLVVGTTVALAPAAGIVAVAVTSFATGELLSDWLETNRMSFFPSLQDASAATDAVTLYGYAPLGDTLTSSTHDDRVFGFSGNDYIVNSGGSDAVFGGLGQDTLDYSAMTFSSPNGIVLDASSGDGSFVVHHNADTDVVESVEVVIGTSVADAFLLGNYGANIAGGGHLESIQASAGNDVALLLNEGGAGPQRVAIDGGSGIDTVVISNDGYNTEIDFNTGTVRYSGGVNAQFSVANFEAARGGDGNDVMLGSDDAEYLLGNGGSDKLFGGGADDFIFFDAEDTEVYGGDGRDAGFVIGNDAVALDLAAAAMEILVGGGGADSFALNGAQNLMAAGGDGSDVFAVEYGAGQGMRTIWGGAGADVISVASAAGGPLGIMVASVAGLTAQNFHLFDRDMLGLGTGFDWGEIDLLLLNPDGGDRITYSDGEGGGDTLSVGAAEVDITAGLPGPGGQYVIEELGTIGFLADTTFSVPDNHWYQVANYAQSFLGSYTGSVFTNAQAISGMITVLEYDDPYKTYVRPTEFAEFIDEEWVIFDPMAEGFGFFGDGWNGEYDEEYDLSGATFVSDWVEEEPGYLSRAHFFQEEQFPGLPINAPQDWFFVGGSLSGSQIVGNGLFQADMTGLADETLAGWLLAA